MGELSEIEAESFEEECSLNEELFEEVRLCESELIDDYLSYRLSANERKSFENNYLTTETRREKLESARIFYTGIKEQNSKRKTNDRHDILGILENQLMWRFALGGLLVLILLSAFFYVFKRKDNSSEIAKVSEPQENFTYKANRAEPNINENLPNQNNPTASITNEKQPKIAVVPKVSNQNKSASSVETKVIKGEKTARFVLMPENLRSEGEQFIEFTEKTTKVSLKLELPRESEKYESYQVTLKNAEGETITKQIDLKNPKITLAAETLKKQTYVLFLEGKNTKKEPEPITEFTFRVRK
ncbi:MAG TPA: hypothetical protein PKY59_07470 [Pyrinomonadaceae bacterium]|nr:hypothetical protein [Pyrinomonadaceae bacterium]